jgi:NAD(P)-dependent dehydrogenase (short-subunit alcohol dehydrogenase family)
MADNENNPPQPSGSWPIPGEQTDELVRAAFPLRLGLVEGKVALVTGAGRGIGEATARLFAVEGAAVVVCDIDGDAAQSVVQSIQERGGEAVAVVADLTKEDEVAAVITTAIDRYGRLDCAVNNAGVSGRFGSFIDLPLHEWQHMINVNLTSMNSASWPHRALARLSMSLREQASWPLLVFRITQPPSMVYSVSLNVLPQSSPPREYASMRSSPAPLEHQ